MAAPGLQELTTESFSTITDIPEALWDRFAGAGNPFLRHRFLRALETSGCTTAATGWEPAHLVFRHRGEPVGVAPAYLKTHSMGEYVFDWGWADAYQRFGLPYYPKLLIAVPFTPCEGPRLLLDPGIRDSLTSQAMHRALTSAAVDLDAHSWHLLFPAARDQALLAPAGGLHRIGCQFHWLNHGFGSFDDFLALLTSRKRKSIRSERRQVSARGIGFEHLSGADVSDAALRAFYVFYQATYLKRGQRPYLNLAFFQALREQQPEQLHLVMAVKDDAYIAAALFLSGENTLYGRYWGCLEEYSHLHFETCYYQGIELAIRKGLGRFDAGAQGEHKLVRGFEPVITHSWHWLAHPALQEAVANFCEEEAADVRRYHDAALQALPFRQAD